MPDDQNTPEPAIIPARGTSADTEPQQNEPAGNPQADPQQQGGDDKPLGEAGEKALEAWKDRARKAEAQAKKLADANKSEEQKRDERVQELERKLPEVEKENLKLRIGLRKKLPEDLINRLQGETEQELEADAEKLLQFARTEDAPPVTGLDPGARGGAPPQSMDDRIRRAAGRT